MLVDERGWGWTASKVRQIRLIEWLVQQSAEHPNQYVPVGPFYSALSSQSEDVFTVAYNDLTMLESTALIANGSGVGGIDSLAAMPTANGHEWVEEVLATRADKQLRRVACRDAMVDWLYSRDAVKPHPEAMPDRNEMLNDPARGVWFAQPFTADDLDAAAAWLHRQGLVQGVTVGAEADGPVRLYLTDAGVECAEEFGSDTRRYLERQRQPISGSGPVFHFGSNTGPFQVAGDHAHQVQNIGANADDLRKLIGGLAEMVRALVPGVAGVSEQEQAALAAATPGRVDRSALQRFADWVLTTVRAGATAALVPAVSAATNEMLTEAARLAGHL